MNIPEKLKVGGKTYTVGTTDRLVLGSDYGGEIIYTDLEIHLRPMAPEQMEATFLHEMVHAIFDHLGVKDHDEIQVDSLAQALHMIIKDNPGMFAPAKPEESGKNMLDILGKQ